MFLLIRHLPKLFVEIECRKNIQIWAEANLSSLLLILLVRSNSDSILYQLKPKRVRIDSTTASGYWTVTEEGLFQFGESPDLPQLKVMLSVLDLLGLLFTKIPVMKANRGATCKTSNNLAMMSNAIQVVVSVKSGQVLRRRVINRREE
jgi:hypothetical protein